MSSDCFDFFLSVILLKTNEVPNHRETRALTEGEKRVWENIPETRERGEGRRRTERCGNDIFQCVQSCTISNENFTTQIRMR